MIVTSAGNDRRNSCSLYSWLSPAARPTSRTPSGSATWSQHGLVRPSFVPPPEIRRLRDLTRLRKAQINERARDDPAAREGAPGRRDQALQRRVERRTRSPRARCSKRCSPGSPIPSSSPSSPRPGCARRSRSCARRSRAASRSSITGSSSRSCSRTSTRSTPRSQNLDRTDRVVLAPHAKIVELLCTIPGVQAHAAQVLIAECGLDMSRVPDRRALRLLGRRMPRPPRVSRPPALGTDPPRAELAAPSQLTECARAAVRTKGTYLAAHFAQLRGRRGEPKAIGAIRHDLLVAYYHIVRDQVPFRELGPDWQRKRYSVEHRARRLQRQLEALGYTVTLDQVEQPANQNKPPEPARQPEPVYRRRDRRRKRPLPKRGRNSGIHRSAVTKPRWPHPTTSSQLVDWRRGDRVRPQRIRSAVASGDDSCLGEKRSARVRLRLFAQGPRRVAARAAGVPAGEQRRFTRSSFRGFSLAPSRPWRVCRGGCRGRVVHPFWPMRGGGCGP